MLSLYTGRGDDGVREMSNVDAPQSQPSVEEYDCTDCGACCQCYPIFASEADAEREPKILEEGIRVDDFLRKRIQPVRNQLLP